MKRLTLLFAGSFLLFAALACGGGESEQISSDPQALLDQAQAAMAELESYHATFVFPAAPGDTQEDYRSDVSYAAPNSYRFLNFIPLPTSATEPTLIEMVLVGDTIYRRQCKDIDIECESWEEQPRGQVVFPGSPALHPPWPLVAMEMAGELDLVGQDKIDGVALTHFRGSANHIRAIFESLRRSATAAGINSLGTECMGVETPTANDANGEPVESEGNCREQTFEETLESQEPGLSFYDENRTTIDIWVSSADFLVHRVAIIIPPNESRDGGTSFIVEYSLFDQVQIEAPR